MDASQAQAARLAAQLARACPRQKLSIMTHWRPRDRDRPILAMREIREVPMPVTEKMARALITDRPSLTRAAEVQKRKYLIEKTNDNY